MIKPNLLIDNSVKLHKSVILEQPFRVFSECQLTSVIGGAFTYIAPDTSLTLVSIGRYCSIADNVVILSQHPTDKISSSAAFYTFVFTKAFAAKTPMNYNGSEKPTFIGNDVWIGSSVKIMPGVKIGDGAIIGAGSIVTKDVDPFSIVGGAPAKLIRMRFSNDIIRRIQNLAWWNYNVLDCSMEWDNFDETLKKLEELKLSNQISLYISPQFKVWNQGGVIVSRKI